MGASPNGLVTDPSERQPHGLVEIKCPAHAEKIPLLDLCTEKQYKLLFSAIQQWVIPAQERTQLLLSNTRPVVNHL